MRALKSRRGGDYFAEAQYIKADVRRGLLHNRAGKRLVCLTEDFLRGFRGALVEECGEASELVLFTSGRTVGDLVGRRLERELSDHYERPLRSFKVGRFDALMNSFFAHHGWGVMRMSYDALDQGLLVAEFRNAIFHSVFKDEPAVNESLLAGFLAGLYAQLSGQDLDCVQTRRESEGQGPSLFVLGLKARLASLREELEDGPLSHDDALKSLAEVRA